MRLAGLNRSLVFVLILAAPDALAGPVIAAAAAITASQAFTAILVGTELFIAKWFMANLVIGGLLYALNKRGRPAGFNSEAQGRRSTIRSPIEPRRVVVGESLVSGPLAAYFAQDGAQFITAEKAVIPAASPFTLKFQGVLVFLNEVFSEDLGVDFEVYNSATAATTFTPLTKVASGPAAGQYSVDSVGLYTFNSADASKKVRLHYRWVKPDQTAIWHWFVIPLAHGEIQEIGEVFLNGEAVGALDSSGMATTGRFRNHVRIKKYLGTTTQTADPDLIAASKGKWTVDHNGLGVAYIVVALRRNPDVFETGVPNINAVVKGIKCLDTRDSQTRWTNNPALILRAYLKATYGLQCDDEEIEDAFVTAAANVCDERVAVSAYSVPFTVDPAADSIAFSNPDNRVDLGDKVQVSNSGGALPGGLAAATNYYVIRLRDGSGKLKLATTYANALAGTAIDITSAGSGTQSMSHIDQPRYTCDGTINLADRMLDIAGGLLTSMAGVAPYSMGSFRLAAGAYSAPVKSWTPNELRGPLQVRARVPRKELFNAVRGTYVNPFKEWQPGDFPPVKNATYASQDGQEIFREIDLPYTINSVRAQRLAKILLEKSRQQIACVAPVKLHGFAVSPNETIDYTDADLGWSNKVFRVTNWKLAENGYGVDVELQEDTAASWAWNAGQETIVDPAPDTGLPDPFSVAPPGAPVITEELYETTGSAGLKARAVLTAEPSASAFVASYVFEYKAHADLIWTVLPAVPAPATTIDDVSPGSYDFRVKAVNAVNVASVYQQTENVAILGLTAKPSAPTNFTARPMAGMAYLQWDKSPDLDVRIGGRAYLRFTPKTVGADWQDGWLIDPAGYAGDTTFAVAGLMTGTYMLKFVDSTENTSNTFASFVVTEALATGFTTVTTVSDHPIWPGTKTNVAAPDGFLQLNGTTLWDSIPGLMDTWGRLDSIGGVQVTGTYDSDNVIDLGTVRTVRLVPTMKVLAFDTGDLWDDRTGLFDDWNSIDGDLVEDVMVRVYVRVTNDNPSGSPTWSAWQPLPGPVEYVCRGIDHKIEFQSADVTHNIRVEELTLTAQAPA